MLACNKPVTIHCKAGSLSVRLVFEARAKCQDFVARFKHDGIHYAINSPFYRTSISHCVNPDQLKSERFLLKVLAEQLKILFHDEDGEGVFILPALDSRSQILSVHGS